MPVIGFQTEMHNNKEKLLHLWHSLNSINVYFVYYLFDKKINLRKTQNPIHGSLQTFHTCTYLNRFWSSLARIWSQCPMEKSKHIATLNLQWISIYASFLPKPFGKKWYIYEDGICNLQFEMDCFLRFLTNQRFLGQYRVS